MGNCCDQKAKRPSNEELAQKFNLTLAQVNQYEKLFKQIDLSGDGRITATELGVAMERLNGQKHSKPALKAMINAYDKNGSGNLDFSEFLSLLTSLNKNTSQKQPSATEQKAMEAFTIFDKDGDGAITVTELRDTLHSLGMDVADEEAKRMLNDVDKNQDGLISKEEFGAMYKQITSTKSESA